jgi:hypothetical protein
MNKNTTANNLLLHRMESAGMDVVWRARVELSPDDMPQPSALRRMLFQRRC